MRSKSIESKPKIQFPAFYKLRNEDLIVLFTDNHIGTVVFVDGGALFTLGFTLGHYSDTWTCCYYMDTWEPWHGKVIIEA
jgi:hypothetical protein